ncbi:MAG: DUF4249 domain-containing protein [Bacteroidota bacterium]
MKRNTLFGIIGILIPLMTACIKTYEPAIESKDEVKFVVTGHVNRGDHIQNVNISTTSPVSSPKYFPVTGCIVKILDAKGNIYNTLDKNDGNYETVIPEIELSPGSKFKVDILTPDGTKIVSDFDEINDCPAVDSIYYTVDTLPSVNPYISTKGIQFYVNLDAENVSSRYFRWEAIETYEFRAVYPIEWIYDGKVHHIVPPDLSRKICWKTVIVKKVFTLTTKNLAQNKYNMLPLHFVDNFSSPRLVYGTSLLLRQYALSEAAFDYWEKIRINSFEQGGLYEKQPLSVKGNLHNISNPDQQILGFFGASTVTSKRIFVQNVENLPLEYNPGCGIEFEKPRLSFVGISPLSYPVYLYATPYGYLIIILEPYCYDCRRDGGDTIKPAYWPY